MHYVTGDTTVAPLTAPYTRLNHRLGDERAVAAATVAKTRIKAVQSWRERPAMTSSPPL